MCELKKIRKVFTSKFVGTGPSSYEKRIYRPAVWQRLRNTGLRHCYLTSLKRLALSIKIQRFEVMRLRNCTPMHVHIVMSQEIWIFIETAVRPYISRTFHQSQYIIAQAKFLNTLIAGVTFLREKNVNHFTTKVYVDKVQLLLGIIRTFLCHSTWTTNTPILSQLYKRTTH